MTSRSSHQPHRAGSEAGDDPSAGGAPQVTSAPDLGPTPIHLTGGGQIYHQRTSKPCSSSIQIFPQSSRTPTANQPPTPEGAPVEQGSCHPPPSRTTPGAKGSSSPTKRRRRPPLLDPAAQDPPYPHPIYTAGAQIRGFPILPPPERPPEGGKSHGYAGARWSSRGRPRVASGVL